MSDDERPLVTWHSLGQTPAQANMMSPIDENVVHEFTIAVRTDGNGYRLRMNGSLIGTGFDPHFIARTATRCCGGWTGIAVEHDLDFDCVLFHVRETETCSGCGAHIGPEDLRWYANGVRSPALPLHSTCIPPKGSPNDFH